MSKTDEAVPEGEAPAAEGGADTADKKPREKGSYHIYVPTSDTGMERISSEPVLGWNPTTALREFIDQGGPYTERLEAGDSIQFVPIAARAISPVEVRLEVKRALTVG